MSAVGAGMCFKIVSNSGVMPLCLSSRFLQRVAVARAGVNERRVELIFAGVEFEQQFQNLVVDLVRVGVFAVNLVDDDDDFQAVASAFFNTNRVCACGPSNASTSSSTPSTMPRMRSTSPPKSAWPGVSTMLIV